MEGHSFHFFICLILDWDLWVLKSQVHIFYVTLLTFEKIDDKTTFAVDLVENSKYSSILLATK